MGRVGQRSILFLCTGNYYRSRFAEILFNAVAARMSLPWKASSRALALELGFRNVGPMAAVAVQALEDRGIRDAEAVDRLPAALTVEELQAADRVVALQHAEHRPLLQERFPDWVERVEYWQVEDAPQALAQIEREVMALISRLLGGSGELPDDPAPATAPQAVPAAKPITLKVGREVAGRRGKGVTTIFDTPLDEAALRGLAATLKQRCGTGGTVKDGRIEIQGDIRDRVVAELEKLGYQVKRVGG